MAEAEAKAVEPEAERPDSLAADVWYSLCGNKAALISLFVIAFLVVIAIVTTAFPQILPYDPYEQDLSASFEAPSAEHWFGTDQQGRDILCRILVGTRISLSVGLLAVSISLVIGVMLGAIAGYKGGIVDTIIMRIMDMMLAIPSILLAIAFMAALGKGIDKAVVAIGLVSIPEYARIVRSQILSVKENDCGSIHHRPCNPWHLWCHPRLRSAWIPGPRRAAACSRVGRHARPWTQLHLLGTVDDDFPGPCNHGHGLGIQPSGRWPA